MVFDCQESDEYEYNARRAPISEFLCKSPREDVRRVRTLINDCYSRIPDSEKSRLKTALRSKNDQEHHSAFFELYCHEFLLRQGMKVELHKTSTGSFGRAVDFTFTSGSGIGLLEATVAYESVQNSTVTAIREQVLAYLDTNAFVPGFRYSLDINQSGDSLPRLKFLAKRISDWCGGLDRAELRKLMEEIGVEHLPKKVFRARKWAFEVTAIPRPNDESESPKYKKSIGIGPIVSAWLQHGPMLYRSLKRKAAHYEHPNHPYIIAINTVFEFGPVDEIDVLEALLGTELLSVNPQSRVQRFGRKPDGLWNGPVGPRNTHVSGVLLLSNLFPWMIARSKPILYRNPFAALPLPESLFDVDTVRWDKNDGKRNNTSGQEGYQLFDIPATWPDM